MDVGHLIGGRFEIVARVEGGAMAKVFRARDQTGGREVAIKLLDDVTRDTVERFEREGRVLAQIQHAGVVGYVGQGTTSEGKLWIAMDWIEGETLSERLSRRTLEVDETIALGIRVGRALGQAHQRGLVHRDIKPSNLLLPDANVDLATVVDFGIVHVGARPGSTQTGMLLGTPGYMAPEQARGAKGLDPRADVFSLGCVLFECLTGQPAFVGEHLLAILAKILLEDAPRVTDLRPDVPGSLADLIAAMLAKDAARRPRDGDAVALLLEGVGHATPTGTRLSRGSSTVITEGEQRIVSVVLAGEPRDSKSRTLVGTEDSQLAQLRGMLPPDSRFEVLADGTAIVAIWGWIDARDQARQAVHAALSIVTLIPEPVVVATGRGVVAGAFPVGEVIDRAVKMLRHAPRANAVRVDQLTAGLLDSRYDIRPDPDGFVVERAHRDDSARGLCGVATSCVGRDRELRLLEDIFAEVRDESTARAVLLVAPGGVGKSRVRQELLLRLAQPYELLIGRGDLMRSGSPFVMLAQALRWMIGITDGQPIEAQRLRLRAHLMRWFSGDALHKFLLLGELVGVPAEHDNDPSLRAARRDPVLMSDLRRTTWIDYVRALTADRPLLIVLEDLHAGDNGTVELIDAALRELADQPIMVLALARPEIRDVFPRLWEGRPLTEIVLTELSKRSAEKLVREVLRDVADDVVSRVAERAGGNAFYLEELIRSVAAGMPSLPETVLASVQARLEALPPHARRLLRAASIYGERFTNGAVSALCGIVTASALQELATNELIHKRASTRGGDAEFAWRHGLVRDAAYAMLTVGDRQLGHRLAGEWLESAGEADASVLAEHFERGGSIQKAIAANLRAGEQALAGNDFLTAIARSERGLELAANQAALVESVHRATERAVTANLERRGTDRFEAPPELSVLLETPAERELLAMLKLVQSDAHRWRGEVGEAEACAVDALDGLAPGTSGWYRALTTIIAASGRRADFAEATRRARIAAETAATDADALNERVTCLCEAGRMLCQAGRYDLSDEIATVVETQVTDLSAIEPSARVQLHRLRAARARHRGDLVGDLNGYRAVLGDFIACGDLRNAANARASVGFAQIELGDWDAAEAELSRALADAERMWLGTVATRARQNLGVVYTYRKEYERAIALFEQVIAESHDQGNQRFEGWTRIYLSNAAHAAGDHLRATREAERAAEVFTETPPARAGALAALARARIHLAGPRDEILREALVPARAAMSILTQYSGIEEFESLVWLALLEVLQALGDPEASVVAREAVARLQARASALEDPDMRTRFLNDVPENRLIVAIANGLSM